MSNIKIENYDKVVNLIVDIELDNKSTVTYVYSLDCNSKLKVQQILNPNRDLAKIPVISDMFILKEEFKNILNKSIYTSFDFIKQYKTWKEVKITYEGKTKKLSKWKYDDLANTMASKRVVGKVQPEKSKQRSKYNFVIEIKADNYEAKIETMGENYVKINAKNLSSYYEVHTALYDYIKNDIFKLSKK